ncbi:MAG: recombination protein RecR [Clostridia bacterium]|nr:recombination protein RecR [Clostridia bacterium]
MYAPPIANLIDTFARMPGIGRKSAARLAFHVMALSEKDAESLIAAIRDVKENIRLCEVCQSYTDAQPCRICGDTKRNQNVICVVESPKDVEAMEKTHEFFGVYHVLHGAISPIDGIGPDDIKVKGLLSRVAEGGAEEVIMATNPSVEGEATALYIAKLLKPFGVKITRIAHGIPVGGDLEFTDEITLARAMDGRREITL